MKKIGLITITIIILSIISFQNTKDTMIQNIIAPEQFIDRDYSTLKVSGDLSLLDRKELNKTFFKFAHEHDIIYIKPAIKEANHYVLTVSSNFENYFNQIPIINNEVEATHYSNTLSTNYNLYIPLAFDHYYLQIDEHDIILEQNLVENINIITYKDSQSLNQFLDDLNTSFPSLNFDSEGNELSPTITNYTLSNLYLVIIISLMTMIPIVFELFLKGKEFSIRQIEGHTVSQMIFSQFKKSLFLLIIIIIAQALLSKIFFPSSLFFKTYLINITIYAITYFLIYLFLSCLSFFLLKQGSLNSLIKGQNILLKSLDFIYILKVVIIVFSATSLVNFISKSQLALNSYQTYAYKQDLYEDYYILFANGNKIDKLMDFILSDQFEAVTTEISSTYNVFSFRTIPFGIDDNTIENKCQIIEVSESYFKKHYEAYNSDHQYYTNNLDFKENCPLTFEEVLDFYNEDDLSLSLTSDTPNFITSDFGNLYTESLSVHENTLYIVEDDRNILNVLGSVFIQSHLNEKDLKDSLNELVDDNIFLPLSLSTNLENSKQFFMNEYIIESIQFIATVLLCIFVSLQTSSLNTKSYHQEIMIKILEGHSRYKVGLQILSKSFYWYLILLLFLLFNRKLNIIISLSIVLLVFISDFILLVRKFRMEELYESGSQKVI